MLLLNIFLVIVVQIGIVVAQTLPFVVTGFLDSATPNSGDAINRGGSVKISGYTVTIPDNLLVEFPALFVPFAEFCGGERASPNEVTITGNVVGDKIIAGQMNVAQLDLAFASGVIERLEFDGAIKIKNGPTVRINDPNAKYSKGFTSLPFYTADDENPSITSFSGFPVCVPREESDPKCPSNNRPTAANNIIPNALHMAPLKVGDYIEYSGVQYGGETIVYGLVANIDIRTSGTQPGFVRVEDAILGVADTGPTVEAARHRFIGLATRSDLLISIYAVDQHPCTGKETERLITSVRPDGSDRNKWSIDVPRNSNNGFYTRNYHIRIGSDVVTTTDGIEAGLYVQPVSEWIFPELTLPGGAPPPNNFANFGHLVNGFGPIDGTIFGPLRPWPGATTPAPSVSDCPPPSDGGDGDDGDEEPTEDAIIIDAVAGADRTVLGGISVLLTGKNATGNNNGLTYQWTQIAGPTVTISGNTTANATFAAPVVSTSANVQREFRVLITHTASGTKGNDTIVITSVSLPVAQNLKTYDSPIIDSLTWASRQSGTATAIAFSNLVDSTASMRIIFNSDNVERVMTKVGVSNGQAQYTFNARSIRSYTSATIRSYLNNVAVGGPVISSTTISAG